MDRRHPRRGARRTSRRHAHRARLRAAGLGAVEFHAAELARLRDRVRGRLRLAPRRRHADRGRRAALLAAQQKADWIVEVSMSGEFTLLIVCCVWPMIGVLVGWGLRGAYEKRRTV